MNKTKRIPIWDNTKLFLIFCVVLGHFMDFYISKSSNMKVMFFYIYLFHMPLFIIISGIFSKKNIDQKNYKKIFEYLILYLFINIIRFLTDMLFHFIFNTTPPILNLFKNGSVPWFIFALFAFNMITIAFEKIDKKHLLIGFIILACFTGYDSNIEDLFALSRIIVFYPFFLFGYLIEPNKLISSLKEKKIQILSTIFVILLFIVIYLFIDKIYIFRLLITGRHSFKSLAKYYIGGGIFRFAYYIVSFILCLAIISIIPNKQNILTKLGKNTLSVYIFHSPVLYLLYYLKINILLDKTTYLLLIPISFIIVIVLSQSFFQNKIKLVVNYFTAPNKS